MRNWLITVRRSLSRQHLEDLLAGVGAELPTEDPIPMSEVELIFAMRGPDDLAERLSKEQDVIDVSPNSPVSLF